MLLQTITLLKWKTHQKKWHFCSNQDPELLKKVLEMTAVFSFGALFHQNGDTFMRNLRGDGIR